MKSRWHRAWGSVCGCVIGMAAWTAVAANTDLHTQRSDLLFSKLRCLTCLHQSVSDSDSPFAEEVKNYVHQAIKRCESNEKILSDLAHKYGQQVLWSPPKQGFHWLIWGMPVGLVLVVLFSMIRSTMRAM
jgi:cytochrome c-type biogenesis protein CcmH/NrfF